MNLKTLFGMIDSEVEWKTQGVTITVIIRDGRSTYGRTEALIEPLYGEGSRWVDVSALILPEGERK